MATILAVLAPRDPLCVIQVAANIKPLFVMDNQWWFLLIAVPSAHYHLTSQTLLAAVYLDSMGLWLESLSSAPTTSGSEIWLEMDTWHYMR